MLKQRKWSQLGRTGIHSLSANHIHRCNDDKDNYEVLVIKVGPNKYQAQFSNYTSGKRLILCRDGQPLELSLGAMKAKAEGESLAITYFFRRNEDKTE